MRVVPLSSSWIGLRIIIAVLLLQIYRESRPNTIKISSPSQAFVLCPWIVHPPAILEITLLLLVSQVSYRPPRKHYDPHSLVYQIAARFSRHAACRHLFPWSAATRALSRISSSFIVLNKPIARSINMAPQYITRSLPVPRCLQHTKGAPSVSWKASSV